MNIKCKFVAILAAAILIQLIAIGCNSYSNDYGTNPYSGTPMQTTPPSNQVYMQNDAFNPKSLTVPKGTTVIWTNKDSFDHTVTSGTKGNPSGLFSSGNLGTGSTFSYKFDNSGTFNYYCTIHQDIMSGTIIVN